MKAKNGGCPVCDGVDPKTCMRCGGKTRLCDWFRTSMGWTHISEIDRRDDEQMKRREERRKNAIDIYDLSTQPDRRKNDDD